MDEEPGRCRVDGNESMESSGSRGLHVCGQWQLIWAESVVSDSQYGRSLRSVVANTV